MTVCNIFCDAMKKLLQLREQKKYEIEMGIMF